MAQTDTLARSDKPLPQFTETDKSTWINSQPIQRESLRGKVVMLVVWTSI